MKKILLAAAISAALLTGCAMPTVTNEDEAGVMVASASNTTGIVTAAKTLMEHQYAPASTKLLIVEPQDGFGKGFEEALRQSGYSVLMKPFVMPLDKEGKPLPFEVPSDAHAVTYVLDSATADGKLLRLLLKIDGKQYSAVFKQGAQGWKAASPWSLM